MHFCLATYFVMCYEMLCLTVEELMLTSNTILTTTPTSLFFNVMWWSQSDTRPSVLRALLEMSMGVSCGSCRTTAEQGWRGLWHSFHSSPALSRELAQGALGLASVKLQACPRMEIPQPLGPVPVLNHAYWIYQKHLHNWDIPCWNLRPRCKNC